MCLHPLKALIVGFPKQGIGDFPQVLVGMDEVQDQSKVRELFGDTTLQGFATWS